jgi:CBS domain-containing protein
MSSPPITCTADTPISELNFETVSGMAVVNADGKLVGVVSKKDLFKSESVSNVNE